MLYGFAEIRKFVSVCVCRSVCLCMSYYVHVVMNLRLHESVPDFYISNQMLFNAHLVDEFIQKN